MSESSLTCELYLALVEFECAMQLNCAGLCYASYFTSFKSCQIDCRSMQPKTASNEASPTFPVASHIHVNLISHGTELGLHMSRVCSSWRQEIAVNPTTSITRNASSH